MKMSILILTHNRPSLFARCLSSVLEQLPEDWEVIVNNDSNDITEIMHPQVTYHYNKFGTLCEVYQFLLTQAQGEFVYYLEDDDYLVGNFANIKLDADLIAGNYMPMYHPTYLIKCMALNQNAMLTTIEFLQQLDQYHLQLGQHVFRRSCISNFVFTKDNNIYNDMRLVMHAATHAASIRTTNKILYYQTTDGGDNISFPATTATLNITKNLDFVEQYT